MDIAHLIGVGCRALDEERFEDFLALCAPDFRYRVLVHSPEIRKQMIWLDLPLEEMRGMLANVARHFRMLDRLQRNVGLVTVRSVGEGRWEADSAFAAYATDRNGISRLFAVGRYLDLVVAGDDGPRLLARDVALQTRDLGVGLHIPL
jgi:methanesulfonate monooxygenase small subunit